MRSSVLAPDVSQNNRRLERVTGSKCPMWASVTSVMCCRRVVCRRHQPSTTHSHHRSIFSLTYLPRRLMHHLAAVTAVVAGAFIFPALLSSYLNGSYNYPLCPETTRPMIILRSNV